MQAAKFGMSDHKVPEILPYPEILHLVDVPELINKFCYVIRWYPLSGLAILIYRDNEQVFFKFSEFNGKIINPMDDKNKYNLYIKQFLKDKANKLVSLMKYAKIPQAMYYFSIYQDKMVLIDMRTSLNKFAGPGMLRDLFSKMVDTQEVIKTVQLTQDVINAIKEGANTYSGNLIIKPSAFKTITRQGKDKPILLPMYGIVTR